MWGGADECWWVVRAVCTGHVTHWLCASGAGAPERDPPTQSAPAAEEEKEKRKAQADEQRECVRGRVRVVAEDDLVLLYQAPAPSSSASASASEPPPGSKGAKGKGEEERGLCCGMYRARGPVKVVRAAQRGTIVAGCESGALLVLCSAALAAADHAHSESAAPASHPPSGTLAG